MVLAAYLGMNLAVWSGDSYKPFEWFVWGLQGVARINTAVALGRLCKRTGVCSQKNEGKQERDKTEGPGGSLCLLLLPTRELTQRPSLSSQSMPRGLCFHTSA